MHFSPRVSFGSLVRLLMRRSLTLSIAALSLSNLCPRAIAAIGLRVARDVLTAFEPGTFFEPVLLRLLIGIDLALIIFTTHFVLGAGYIFN